MKIQVAPDAQEDLLAFLRRADCHVEVVDDETVIVDIPAAFGEEQARMEVDVYLKAWQVGRSDLEARLVDAAD